jgi:hypothetical protein
VVFADALANEPMTPEHRAKLEALQRINRPDHNTELPLFDDTEMQKAWDELPLRKKWKFGRKSIPKV